MGLQFFLLAATLCLGLGTQPTADIAVTDAQPEATSTLQDGQKISGKYNGVIFGGDGWAYFTIGDVQMRMKTAAFPDPIPTPGTKMTATGCTPDPNHDGGFICTGLS